MNHVKKRAGREPTRAAIAKFNRSKKESSFGRDAEGGKWLD